MAKSQKNFGSLNAANYAVALLTEDIIRKGKS